MIKRTLTSKLRHHLVFLTMIESSSSKPGVESIILTHQVIEVATKTAAVGFARIKGNLAFLVGDFVSP